MRRYLVVGNETLGGRPLADKVLELMAAEPSCFHLVAPATHAYHHHLTWTEGEAVAIARKRLDSALVRLRALGVEVDGEVGDGRPLDAVGDAIRAGPAYDGIVLSTMQPGLSRWLHQDLPHRLERSFGLPVIHVVSEVNVPA